MRSSRELGFCDTRRGARICAVHGNPPATSAEAISMARTSALVFAGIAPHPPIMVPEVGREAVAEVRSSIDAMAALTERIVNAGAETVIIISPRSEERRVGKECRSRW